MVVKEIVSDTDYRQNRLKGEETYFTPISPDTRAQMDAIWQDLTLGQAKKFKIIHKGRALRIPAFHSGIGRFAFFDLCGENLGPGDYLAYCEQLRLMMIDDIPQLGRSNFNEAKRFVTLIDTLYEANIKLICSAAARPEMLYLEGEGVFEFERTASRLNEMQGADWGC